MNPGHCLSRGAAWRVPEGMKSALAPLASVEAYRITEIPRQRDPDDQRAGTRGRAQLTAALTAAYHAGTACSSGGTVAFGWVRTAAGGPVHVLTVGGALVGSTDDKAGEVLLALPSGARGTALRPGDLAALAGQLSCWREVAGISDGLLAADDAAGRAARQWGALPLDEGLLGSWSGPFGWLVIGEPLTLAELREIADDVGSQQRVAERTADRFPEQAVLARRLKARHAELQRGESAGFWRVTILAGGIDARDAARVAGLLCASADLDGLPYALSPAAAEPSGPRGLAGPGGDGVPSAPFYGSTELLAAFACAAGRGPRGAARAPARVRRHPGGAA